MAHPILQVVPLEEARVHSLLSGQVPDFPSIPGTRRVIIFNNTVAASNHQRAIFVRVPEKFTGPGSNDPERTWGLNILVRYPDMIGLHGSPNERKSAACTGLCSSGMMISIYNHIGSVAPAVELRFWDLQRREHNLPHSGVSFSEVESDRFSMVIKETYGTNPDNTANALNYIQRGQDGTIAFLARCYYNTEVHLCYAYGSSNKTPGVDVEYHFNLEDIEYWPEIRGKVLALVDSLIIGAFDVNTNN
jgi:hypothetical protein